MIQLCTHAILGGSKPLIFTVDTTKAGSASDTFILPLATGTTNINVNWGDGNIEDFNTSGNKTHVYSISGIYDIRITGTFVGLRFYTQIDRLKVVELKQWGDIVWKSFNAAFGGCSNLVFSNTDTPKLNLTNNFFQYIFQSTKFNESIEWFPSTITDYLGAFQNCTLFNDPSISNLNVSNVTRFSGMFFGCTSFNQPLNNWNLSSATNISNIFQGCTLFNQSLNNWNVSNVTDMAGVFYDCTLFNQSLSNWNTSNVISMNSMFRGCTNFNQPLNTFNTSNVNSFGYLFMDAISFNQDITGWDTSKVINFNCFRGANSFNQNISTWNVSSGTTFLEMFLNASSFNQNLGAWNLGNGVTNMNAIFANSGMSTANYTDTIVEWANKVFTNGYPLNVSMTSQGGRTFDTSRSGGANFANAGAARTYLTTATGSGGAGWTISGDTII